MEREKEQKHVVKLTARYKSLGSLPNAQFPISQWGDWLTVLLGYYTVRCLMLCRCSVSYCQC